MCVCVCVCELMCVTIILKNSQLKSNNKTEQTHETPSPTLPIKVDLFIKS